LRKALAAVSVALCLGSAALAVEDPLFSPVGIPSNYAPAYLIAEPAGKGWAITFLDDPNFRGFCLGTSLLFGNAAILAPSFRP
jgi:hypothetical protein